MQREQAKQVVSERGWLSLLPEEVRSAFLARTLLRKFKKGDAIYALQDPPGGMYGLVSGSLGIVMAPATSAPEFVHTALPGFWFGEAAVITGEPRRVGMTARSDVSTLHLPAQAISELTASDPSLWRHIAVNAVLNLDLALRAFHDAKLRDRRARIASILLRLAGYQTPLFVPDRPCRVDINQTELGEMSGLSRNVVNRVLTELAKEGLVDVGYAHIDMPLPGVLVTRVSVQIDR